MGPRIALAGAIEDDVTADRLDAEFIAVCLQTLRLGLVVVEGHMADSRRAYRQRDPVDAP